MYPLIFQVVLSSVNAHSSIAYCLDYNWKVWLRCILSINYWRLMFHAGNVLLSSNLPCWTSWQLYCLNH